MTTSPSPDNYSIATGSATFTPTGGALYDLGNIVNMSVSAEVVKKSHFKTSGGRRTKDKTVVVQTGATVKFALDEITAKNIALFALGEVVENTDGTVTIDGLSKTEFTGVLKFTGDNEIGTQLDWEGKVSFIPEGDFQFIDAGDQGDWQKIAITADVEEDETLGFGKWTIRETEAEA